MSLIDSALKKRLYDDAQVHDEHATTRLWEYILQGPFSSANCPWVRASQQPVTFQDPLRRVDLVIEYLDLVSGSGSKVLMVEAKRHGATQTEINEVETQAWEAASSYSEHEHNNLPVWYLTCVGTTARVWIFQPFQHLPIPFMPGAFALSNIDGQYLDIAHYGADIMKALKYIRIQEHHQPPAKFLLYQSPSVSSAEPSEPSQSPRALKQQAAGQTPIPLDQNKWEEIRIEQNNGSEILAVTVDGLYRFRAPKKDWRLQLRGGKGDFCFAHVERRTRRVFWVQSLELVAADGTSQQQSSMDNAESSDWQSGQMMDTALGSTSQQEGASQEPVWIQVKVKVETHSFSKDVWKFKDEKGHTVSREWTSWLKAKKDGVSVWMLERKGITYYTTQKL